MIRVIDLLFGTLESSRSSGYVRVLWPRTPRRPQRRCGTFAPSVQTLVAGPFRHPCCNVPFPQLIERPHQYSEQTAVLCSGSAKRLRILGQGPSAYRIGGPSAFRGLGFPLRKLSGQHSPTGSPPGAPSSYFAKERGMTFEGRGPREPRSSKSNRLVSGRSQLRHVCSRIPL